MKITLTDKLPITGTRELTPEGYLRATAAVTAVGIQRYYGDELAAAGFTDLDEMTEYGVFRPADTVFNPETAETARLKPVTRNHPGEDVTVDNNNVFRVGVMGETVEPLDETRLGARIQIEDSQTIEDIGAGVVEVSLGYDCLVVEEQGVHDGESYAYRFSGPMLINHLAVVEAGRCGDSVKILDGGHQMTKKQLIKMLKAAGLNDAAIKARLKAGGIASLKDGGILTDEQIKKTLPLADMDLEGIMPMVAEKIMPKVEELVASPEFAELLASKVAAAVAGAAPAPEGDLDADPLADPDVSLDADPSEDPDEGKMDAKTVKKMVDAKVASIRAADAKRASCVDAARKVLGESYNPEGKKDREILEDAVNGFVDSTNGKSDDYLLGIVDTISADRVKATKAAADFTDTVNGVSVEDAPKGGLELRKMRGEGK